MSSSRQNGPKELFAISKSKNKSDVMTCQSPTDFWHVKPTPLKTESTWRRPGQHEGCGGGQHLQSAHSCLAYAISSLPSAEGEGSFGDHSPQAGGIESCCCMQARFADCTGGHGQMCATNAQCRPKPNNVLVSVDIRFRASGPSVCRLVSKAHNYQSERRAQET